MFNAGDIVVHPMHGAGVIGKIEDRDFLGKKARYYVLDLCLSSLDKVLVPVERAIKLGIRKIISPDAVGDILEILKTGYQNVDTKGKSWSAIYRKNMEKMKSGHVLQISEVLSYLHHRNKQKDLGLKDGEMYAKSFNLVASEVMFAKKVSSKHAKLIILKALEEGA
ncbi:MAG: CarD family transcriptional regulator [bacterium]|jgi:CarD family transcriptional regulator|nr:CarD family transcriptional regulator [bacterium]